MPGQNALRQEIIAAPGRLQGSTIVIDSDSYTIQSFDCTTLVVTSSNVLAAGDQLKVTLVRQ